MPDQEDIERRADFIIRELDEFCALATKSETIDLIHGERLAIGQILTRAQLIISFLKGYKNEPDTMRGLRFRPHGHPQAASGPVDLHQIPTPARPFAHRS